jgi:hypothetical protein
MLNALMSAPNVDAEKAGPLEAAILMNIQSPAVERFLETFPSTTLDELIAQATEAGYEIDVLESDAANRMPRTVVGKGQLQI